MPCGAILTFDRQTDASIRAMWQAIEDAGLPSVFLEQNYPPHLTLLACEDMDLEGILKDGLPRFLSNFPPLVVDFPNFGVFTGNPPVIFLGATRSPALSALHAAFWEMAEPFTTNPHPLYRPGAWVPHVTLNLVPDPTQTGAMVQTLMGTPRPAYGQLVYLQIINLESGVTSLFAEQLGATSTPSPQDQ